MIRMNIAMAALLTFTFATIEHTLPFDGDRRSAGNNDMTNDQQQVGTILVAHGGDSLWNSYVYDLARTAKTGGPVHVSFLMGPAAVETRFQDVVRQVEAKNVSRIIVVPILVSSYSGHYDQIRYLTGADVKLDETMAHHLHMSGIEKANSKVPMKLVSALDSAPEVARVLNDRALLLATTPREQAVMIVGHGPNSAEDYAAWMRHLRAVANSVKTLGGFKDVQTELLRDDAPPEVRAEGVRRIRDLIMLQNKATGRDVVVVPVLISSGAINRDRIPADLAGMPMIYRNTPLLPHPEVARWVETQVKKATGSEF